MRLSCLRIQMMVATMASVMMLTGCGNSLVDDAKETCLPQNLGYEDLTYEKVFDSYPYAESVDWKKIDDKQYGELVIASIAMKKPSHSDLLKIMDEVANSAREKAIADAKEALQKDKQRALDNIQEQHQRFVGNKERVEEEACKLRETETGKSCYEDDEYHFVLNKYDIQGKRGEIEYLERYIEENIKKSLDPSCKYPDAYRGYAERDKKKVAQLKQEYKDEIERHEKAKALQNEYQKRVIAQSEEQVKNFKYVPDSSLTSKLQEAENMSPKFGLRAKLKTANFNYVFMPMQKPNKPKETYMDLVGMYAEFAWDDGVSVKAPLVVTDPSDYFGILYIATYTSSSVMTAILEKKPLLDNNYVTGNKLSIFHEAAPFIKQRYGADYKVAASLLK